MGCRKISILFNIPARPIRFAMNYPYGRVALSFSSDCEVIYILEEKICEGPFLSYFIFSA